MSATASRRLLQVWEAAVGQPPATREPLVLGCVPASLAERNRLALERYATLFGPAVELHGACPHCRAEIEIVIDAAACARELPDPPAQPFWHELETETGRVRFRLPQPSDVSALQGIVDEESFAEALLQRCIQGPLPPAALQEAVSRRMEALAPGASLSFRLACPECASAWSAPLDPVDLLWLEVRTAAERLLTDVAALARGWGWSERDILRMSPTRRAAYLQLLSV